MAALGGILPLLTSRIAPANCWSARAIRTYLRLFNMRRKSILSENEIQTIINSIVLSPRSHKQFKINPIHYHLTIIILCSERDKDIISNTISFALEATNHQFVIKEVVIVAPMNLIPTLNTSLSQQIKNSNVRILNENLVLDFAKISERFEKTFPTRGSWCAQQILKVEMILNSRSDFALIIDADTLLLRKRNWVDETGSQILTPSLEYQPQYYQFLEILGVNIQKPSLSFVSHHMLYRVKTFREMFEDLSIRNTEDLILKIENSKHENLISPFCVDYELYAQYLYSKSSAKYRIERWANLSLPRDFLYVFMKQKLTRLLVRQFFNSVSFHWWALSGSNRRPTD